MENLAKLYYDWEIQLLVLLSFAIQLFLFFTGGLRRCSIKLHVWLSIWMAYLGADMVAVYALGYLSRHEDAHPLAFFWAPFLLVHLGGQDTITAFAVEDNSLWLRHLLNLAVQVFLAAYVFWKSIGRHNVELLVSGTFVFIVGVIKYGERIWSLRCGQYGSLEESPGNQYQLPWLVEIFEELPVERESTDQRTYYCDTVCLGVCSMPTVFSIFVSRMAKLRFRKHPFKDRFVGIKQNLKVLEIGLGIMYDDLYTKALVLRTRGGVILRCMTQICSWIAFTVFFLGCDRGRYSRVDVAITYSLFVGGLFLEGCGLISLMASPWTLAWLKARKHEKLAWLSLSLLSSGLIGWWSEKRPLWSNAVGQYNFYGWIAVHSEQHKPIRSFSQQCMTMVIRMATLFGVEKEKVFWISKLLDREHIKVDRVLLKCLVDRVDCPGGTPGALPTIIFRCLRGDGIGPLAEGFILDAIGYHVLTEAHLRKYPRSDVDAADTNALVEHCQKLSRYMMYLMVASPSLLPVDESSVAMLEWCRGDEVGRDWVRHAESRADTLQLGKETLEEIKGRWMQLIIFAAIKARSETLAAQLARGGELLTFVWLQLGFYISKDEEPFNFNRPELTWGA
ncbi:uncharacterized protein C2845_PM13G06230 [Panicum miliaceum]|uniref:DUF4220 domain-containing protein n=1 Tax=Panicum miliaceum TaxID=4540 RepID=A0A3L6RG59_PANMI|nr:uncharacterized protein C2845_PM13G06230 [Panicum miliaceum]